MMPDMIDFISWVAVIGVLLAYTQAAERPAVFDAANVVFFLPVALPAILTGAYSSAAISVSFGLIGAANLLRRRQP